MLLIGEGPSQRCYRKHSGYCSPYYRGGRSSGGFPILLSKTFEPKPLVGGNGPPRRRSSWARSSRNLSYNSMVTFSRASCALSCWRACTRRRTSRLSGEPGSRSWSLCMQVVVEVAAVFARLGVDDLLLA